MGNDDRFCILKGISEADGILQQSACFMVTIIDPAIFIVGCFD